MTTRAELLRRLLGPPGPRDAEAAARWAVLGEDTRRRLRRAAVDPVAAGHLDDPFERWLVDTLAAERARRSLADVLGPLLTGLLVLSTLWGFGRAAFPTSASAWLLAGLMGAAVTTIVGWRRGARRRTAAATVRRHLHPG